MGEPPASPEVTDAQKVLPSAFYSHSSEAKARAVREAGAAALCVHNRLMYPADHPDFVYGCPACIRHDRRELFSSDAQLLAALAAAEKPAKKGSDR